MSESTYAAMSASRTRTSLPIRNTHRIPVIAFGLSLGVFLGVTYSLCVAFDLLFPGQAMYQSWLQLLPGFTWLSWSSFFLGLAESVAYGWYMALVFGPLYNFFASQSDRVSRKKSP